MKLGSLFDGSGGFPLAGAMCGIEPVWASEIEPFPIRVTKQRFPHMKHLGDVCNVHGDQIEPVDIITFGSPCQDLSIAGKQKGIHSGERSNLFFQAIRVIREMRNVSANKYPRFALWENVPGAFSSNRGKDFQAVLQAFCNIGNGVDDGTRWGNPSASEKEQKKTAENIYVPFPDRGGGNLLGASWETVSVLPGKSMMLNIGEFPNVERESILSQILQVNVPEKYSLSPKACQGILNRARKRNKMLPNMLEEALMEVVGLDGCDKGISEENTSC